MGNLSILLLLCTAITGSLSQWDNTDRGSGARGRAWNPFQDSFDFGNIRGAPSGLGHFSPGFGSFSPGFGGLDSGNGNNRFGSFGGNSDNSGGNRRKSASGGGNNGNRGNGNNGNSGGGSNGNGFGDNNVFTWSAPSMTDFSSTFDSFKKQFATNFPAFGNNGGFGSFGAPSGFGNFGGGSFGTNNGEPDNGESVDTATSAPQPVTSTSTTTSATTSTTTTVVSRTNNNVVPQTNNHQQMTVTNRNCSQEGLVIGLSPSSSDLCGSIECQCFHGIYFCYSTCLPPPVNQTCDAVINGNDNCPSYSKCGPLVNSTDVGAANIFRCDPRSQGVHPGICWMYEILFGKLTEPLGYFESVAEPPCSVSTQCVCGSNGFIQPALLRQEDFKTPANNQVYPRSSPGRKGAFASS